MKKWFAAMLFSAAIPAHAVDQDYKLLTVASYLNFYLLNLNACEDFHSSLRRDAYEAEGLLYPWLDKLDAKTKGSIDAGILENELKKRREKVSNMIKEGGLKKEGGLTEEQCRFIIDIVKKNELDKTMLKALE
jgi:hypothetical protein